MWTRGFIFSRIVLTSFRGFFSFKKTLACVSQDFSGPKAIFEIQYFSIRDEDFNLKTNANFLVDLRFYCLAFKTNEN